MSDRVSSLLPGRWAAAHLPPLSGAQLAEAKGAVTVGVAPVTSGTPAPVASAITQISHATFVSGMSASFVTAAVVALVAVVIAAFTKRGRETSAAVAI